DSTVQLVSVTDSKGNPYQRAVGPTTQAGLATQSIYYATGIAAAAANTNAVTVTFTGPATYADIRAAEYSGVDPANPVDVTAAAQGSGTMSNSGSAVTTNGNDLLVGANVVQTVTSAAGAGFTNRVITSPNGDILEDRIVSVPGSYSATAPLSSGAWIMQMVAFRALSGGSADTQPPTAPANLTATAVSGSQIGLSWTASTDNVGVTGYLVERCAGVGCTTFAQAATIPPGATFTDTGLTASTSYSYRLRAVDAAGNRSAYSNVASAATAFIVLPGVTTLTFTRTEQFISTGGNVTWFVDAIPGGSAASGTITATGLYAPPASVGTHIVSASNESTSANATVYVVNYPGTFTRDI